MRMLAFILAVSLVAGVSAQATEPETKAGQGQPRVKVGYDDTPVLPDGQWKVHDKERPNPVVIRPGSASTDAGPGAPPSDATVLFDGRDLSAWTGKGGKAQWNVAQGAMEVNGTGDIETREAFGDCQLHVEWRSPAPSKGESQGRGNSGVFLMGRYEIQVLDSFDNVTYADGQAAALYGQRPPLVNASQPPGQWQIYDIVFEAPKFAGDKLVKPAYVTLLHNGVVVHHRAEILGATAHRAVAQYTPHAPTGPIKLQDHGDPVRYRNIWVRPLGGK